MKNEEQQAEIIQLILAKEQRNAGRDYHEYFIPGTIKLALATWRKEKLDLLAKDNGRLFGYRFGFSATRIVREKVVDFQNKYDLSDAEIRWLKRAGYLRLTRTELTIDASRLMPIYGWIQVALLSFFFSVAIFHVGFSEEPEWKRTLGQLTLGILWLGAGTVLLKLFVTPWQTLNRSGAITAGIKTTGGAR